MLSKQAEQSNPNVQTSLAVWVRMQALQAQCKMWPPAVITGLSAVVNVPVNLVLINLFGFEGAAAAFSATRIIMFLMLLGGWHRLMTMTNNRNNCRNIKFYSDF